MLQQFITTNRDAIIAKARGKLTARPFLSVTANELDNGVPMFLLQLSDTLAAETAGTRAASDAMRSTATRHGRELSALGFTISQVVHDYGDICQAVTELALQQDASITTEEFQTLNRCLDTAIADAVTEHARITAEARSTDQTDQMERAGQIAHETRDLLNTATLAFEALKRGAVAINGSTGAVLGRSLRGLRQVVENTLTDTRIEANQQRRERIGVAAFLRDIAMAGQLHAEDRQLQFIVEPIDVNLAVFADPQLLASAVTNLLNNAYKYTRQGGRVVLRARNEDGRLLIEVEDECGGMPDNTRDPFQAFGERRGADRSGLGLGLSIARRVVRIHGGEISIRNTPGQGCVFVIDVPLASPRVDASR